MSTIFKDAASGRKGLSEHAGNCHHQLPSCLVKANPDFFSSPRTQRGFTLIELLIAVVIISIGLLGSVSLQAVAKKSSYDAKQRVIAAQIGSDIIERMRNFAGTGLLESFEGTYTGQLSAPAKLCQSAADNCTAAEMVTAELYQWEQAMMGNLEQKGGKGVGGLLKPTVCISHTNGRVKVVVAWQGRNKLKAGGTENCGSAGAKRRQLVLKTVIFS